MKTQRIVVNFVFGRSQTYEVDSEWTDKEVVAYFEESLSGGMRNIVGLDPLRLIVEY